MMGKGQKGKTNKIEGGRENENVNAKEMQK